jgi:UDP-N-acetylglucosamine 2-epimerase
VKKFLIVVGTRPELIKVASVIKELEKRKLRDKIVIVNTAQHKDLLDPYWTLFSIEPDVTLDVMKEHQELSHLTSRVIDQFQRYISGVNFLISGILAQGDTTTVFGISLVAFYNHIPFYHLEAGLRTFDIYNPYPEEFNRKATSIVASFHFCPTAISKQNLINEGVREDLIQVVGNTVVDVLVEYKDGLISGTEYRNINLRKNIHELEDKVLITCHRRENHGENLTQIIRSVKDLAINHPELQFIWIAHPNPKVMQQLYNSGLSELENILLIEPIDYEDLIKLMNNVKIIISDSGGIQEEAPSFKVPVLILREATERPEGVQAGFAFLVGAKSEKIKEKFEYCLNNEVRIVSNPYGDGRASERVVDRLMDILN